MKIAKLFFSVFFLSGLPLWSADTNASLIEGKTYSVSINKSVATISRKSDKKAIQIKGLLWGESPLQKQQPKLFFNDESNAALFLMNNYQYYVVNIDELFQGQKTDFVYTIIEGGAYKLKNKIDRSNLSWELSGIYPNMVVKGSATNPLGKADFSLFLEGEKANTIVSSNPEADKILRLRIVDYTGRFETVLRFR